MTCDMKFTDTPVMMSSWLIIWALALTSPHPSPSLMLAWHIVKSCLILVFDISGILVLGAGGFTGSVSQVFVWDSQLSFNDRISLENDRTDTLVSATLIADFQGPLGGCAQRVEGDITSTYDSRSGEFQWQWNYSQTSLYQQLVFRTSGFCQTKHTANMNAN